MDHRNSGTLSGGRVLKALPERGRPYTFARQFGQLNLVTWDFRICSPILSHRMRLDWLQLRVVRRIIRMHKSPFYLQAAREQPVTLALLPVESCEML